MQDYGSNQVTIVPCLCRLVFVDFIDVEHFPHAIKKLKYVRVCVSTDSVDLQSFL